MTTLWNIRQAVSALQCVPDTAQHVHEACLTAFEAAGFEVFPECSIKLPDGAYGRLDIVLVDSYGNHVAIEIDARKPRRGSLAKMRHYQSQHDGYTVAICRGVTPTQIKGLDLVLGVDVRQATSEEIADKSIVGRWMAERRA